MPLKTEILMLIKQFEAPVILLLNDGQLWAMLLEQN